jgi:hypothetical protein
MAGALALACSRGLDTAPPQPPLRWLKRFAEIDGGGFRDVAFDRAGNLIAVGGVGQAGLPTTPGAAQREFGGYEDGYVVKLSPAGEIVWATYLGGAEVDRIYAVEVDADGNVILGGRGGASFPVTANAAQREFVGGGETNRVYPQPQDGWAAKLDGASGALLWATFFGASDRHSSIVRDVAVDPTSGDIYLAASSDSDTYPPQVREAFKRGHRATLAGSVDGVLAKLSPDGSRFEWATYLGGSGFEGPTPSVRVGPDGNPVALYTSFSSDAPTTPLALQREHRGDSDFYLVKFSPSGALLWATLLGGEGNELFETHNLAVRNDNAIVIAAGSTSARVLFPTSEDAFSRTNAGNGSKGKGERTNYPGECVVAVVSADGSRLLAGTYYGGSQGDGCEGVDVDEAGRVYVTGAAYSGDLPLSKDALETRFNGDISGFLAVFDPGLTKLEYATYVNYGPKGSMSRALAFARGVVALGGTSLDIGRNVPDPLNPPAATVWTYELAKVKRE